MAELAGAAGQTRSKGPRFEADSVTFDGKKGELRLRQADGTIVPVNYPAEFVILKKRNVLKSYPMFSTEYDYASTIISLFSSETGRVQHVASGTPKQLREKFPQLKWQQVCYALYNGEVVKLEIKGASASSFIEYSKQLQDQDLHSYQVVTIITGAGTGKKGAVEYKFMEFGSRDLDEAEFDQVKSSLERVTKELYEIDRHYAEKKAEKMEGVDTPAPDLGELASEFDEEINPEDIPF